MGVSVGEAVIGEDVTGAKEGDNVEVNMTGDLLGLSVAPASVGSLVEGGPVGVEVGDTVGDTLSNCVGSDVVGAFESQLFGSTILLYNVNLFLFSVIRVDEANDFKVQSICEFPALNSNARHRSSFKHTVAH